MRKWITKLTSQKRRDVLEWLGLSAFIVFGFLLALFGLTPVTQAPMSPRLSDSREVIIGMPRRPENLSLDSLMTAEDFDILSKLHLSLVSIDSNGKIYPGLATNWSVHNDSQEYVFHLRDNLTFANGKPVACTDALNTLSHVRQVRGDESLWAMRLVSSLECQSRNDLVIRLTQPSPFFLVEMADLRYSIRQFEGEQARPLDGLGPYAIEKIDKNSGSVVLRRKDNHPLLNERSASTIEFKVVKDFSEAKELLASGKLHLYPLRGHHKEDAAHVLESGHQDRVWLLVLSNRFNKLHPGLAGCLNDNVDRQTVLGSIGDPSFVETSSPIPLDSSLLLNSPTRRDTSGDAGKCLKFLRRPLRIFTMTHYDPLINTAIVSDLTKLGAHSSVLTSLEKAVFLKSLAGDLYDVAVFSIGLEPSPLTSLALFYSKNPGFPPSHWADEETAQLTAKLSQSRNELEAKDLTSAILGRALRTGPLVPLFFENERYLAGKCVSVGEGGEHTHLGSQYASVEHQKGCVE